VATQTPSKDDRVFAKNLPPKILAIANLALTNGADISPEKFGALLVAVESHGGAVPLQGDLIKRILRGRLMIHEFAPVSGTEPIDLNIITDVSEPFMSKHLTTPELILARETFEKKMLKVALEFEQLSEKIPKDEWKKSGRMNKLMAPVVDPVIDLICGKKRTLESSLLPDGVKKALLAIDANIIQWFGKNGTGKPADLYEARRSALIGFISTRSLAAVWVMAMVKKDADKGTENARKFSVLLGYLNLLVSFKIDDFVNDTLISQPDQTFDQKRYIEVKAGKFSLKSKAMVPSLRIGNGLKVVNEKSFSPRLQGTPSSARSTIINEDDAKVHEKKAKAELMKKKLERAKFVDKLAKDAGLLEIDPQCYQFIKNKVLDMSTRGYDHLKKNSIQSVRKYANEYYADPSNHKKVKDGLPGKVQEALMALQTKLLGNPFEEDADEGSSASPLSTLPRSSTATTNSQASSIIPTRSDLASSSTTGPTIFSQPSSGSRDLSALQSTVNDDDDTEKREPSSSSEVGSGESPS
jgi:hypothetical protein